MANEAVIIELLGYPPGAPISYTISAGTAIPKGTLMELDVDPRTITIHSGADKTFVGIAASESATTDTFTRLAVYTNGIFDITAAAAGATTIGNMCATSATANMITAADASDLLQQSTVGYCLETHGNDEVAAVRILK